MKKMLWKMIADIFFFHLQQFYDPLLDSAAPYYSLTCNINRNTRIYPFIQLIN